MPDTNGPELICVSDAAGAHCADRTQGSIERYRLTSLAAIKRACVTGAKLEIIATDLPHLQETAMRAPRPIARVQTNAIAVKGCHRPAVPGRPQDGFTFDPDVESWIYWPKAKDVTAHGDETFTLDHGSGRAITYRVLA